MREDCLSSPHSTSIESGDGEGHRMGRLAWCGCCPKDMFLAIPCGLDRERKAFVVALDLKNMFFRIEEEDEGGGEHCQRESGGGGGGGGRFQVAFPVPAFGCCASQRKFALLPLLSEVNEEFETETPRDRFLDESFLSNRTVSFRYPKDTFRW